MSKPAAARDPAPVASIVRDIMRDLRPSAGRDPAAQLAEVDAVWRRAVGQDLAEQTRVTSYREGVLDVRVSAAPLAAELESFAMSNLLDALRETGLVGLHRIRFRVGGAARGRGTHGER